MALRTFHSNPSLGGFGNESTNNWIALGSSQTSDPCTDGNGDAFAQIIKELVDNAVDACSHSSDSISTKKRVRVVIESFEPDDPSAKVIDDDANEAADLAEAIEDGAISEKKEILRVTVSDNGCGMESIQACVDPFHTSKAHAAKPDESATLNHSDAFQQGQTAGRYGIGLTLCLLHAQRLIPSSCACIKSSTVQQSSWTSMMCVVDTEGDSVRCFRREQIAKSFPAESGTSVSVLVPGGTTARLAWPRLAEYFARFKLSLGLQCSLEVLAPTLSRVPLTVRPLADRTVAANNNLEEETNGDAWIEGFDETLNKQSQDGKAGDQHDAVDERSRIWKAAQAYLERPIELKNVAHSIVSIRIDDTAVNGKNAPKLEVDFIVHGPDDESDSELLEDADEPPLQQDNSAALSLVRMINRIPLLDGAEAVACGLVQAVVSKKRMWNSFGLEVSTKYQPVNVTKLPVFSVKDSEQVAPFFRTGGHAVFEQDEDLEAASEEEDNNDADSTTSEAGKKRKRTKSRRTLLPAKVRLGNILVIVQIHAQPSMMPLPTLSKGRLPVDNAAIDTALELGLINCLRQLQKTNPDLLLTAHELRKVERDARYVPAVASALASILSKSSAPNKKSSLLRRIKNWGLDEKDTTDDASTGTVDSGSSGDTRQGNANILKIGSLVERRMRQILVQKPKAKKNLADNENGQEEESSQAEDSEQEWDSIFGKERIESEAEESDEASQDLLSMGENDQKEGCKTLRANVVEEDEYEDWV